MDIVYLLQEEYSKPTTLLIADHIAGNENRFRALMELMLGDDKLMAQRSAWVVSYCLESHPVLATPYLAEMLDKLNENVHDGVKRCVLRSLYFMELPEEYHGRILDVSFNFLMDRKAPVALRVFAMTVIHKLSKKYPDIRHELLAYLEDEMEYGTAGFKNRAGKIIKNIL